MPTTTETLEAAHTLRCQLAAGSVDANTGVIHACTVAKAGVQATGKFVLIDAQGKITRDEKLGVKKLPVFTDAKTLDTLMAAAKLAGKRVKMREDHDDSVGARAGYVSGFARVVDDNGDRVVTDLHVFKSYRNRAVMLETAQETPEEIGLSIDFTPTFEIAGDRALMRVSVLTAVDIVDEGAITPDGLLLSARVDSRRKSETDVTTASNQHEQMASPTLEEIMASVNALAASLKECQASIGKMAPAAVADPKADEALKAVKAENEKLAAELKTQADSMKAVTASVAQMKKEKALLGFRGTDAERAALAAAPVEDIEKLTSSQKDYLSLVAEHAEKMKCKKSDAHLHIQRTHKEAYAAHLRGKGVYDPAKANMKAA